MASTRYFAYGSNMDDAQMAQRCPDSVLLSRASAEGWRFRINSRGYATIVREHGAIVHGLLWLLTESDVVSLNRYEGVAIGLYVIDTVNVQLANGRRDEAMVYVAADDRPGTPKARYIRGIMVAGRAHGFPREYLRELRQWLPRES